MESADEFSGNALERNSALVALTADWLDEHWPEEELGVAWVDAIDTSELQMMHPCQCVCGQLGVIVARHEGYETNTGFVFGYDSEQIALQDHVYTTGWHVFSAVTAGMLYGVRAYEDYESNVELFAELRTIVHKRLDYEKLPHFAATAFGGGVVSSFWIDEIVRRRELRSSS